MKNWWISWWHETEFGAYEFRGPWWISGEDAGGRQSVCAAVRAPSEEAAEALVSHLYDAGGIEPEIRFCEERPVGWSPFCDRFPRANWMEW
jgi:hypothetical protein